VISHNSASGFSNPFPWVFIVYNTNTNIMTDIKICLDAIVKEAREDLEPIRNGLYSFTKDHWHDETYVDAIVTFEVSKYEPDNRETPEYYEVALNDIEILEAERNSYCYKASLISEATQIADRIVKEGI